MPPTLPLDVERTGCTPLHCHSTSSVPKRCAQARVAVPLARNRTLRAEWQCELGRSLHESGLFGGSCGLAPRRRCQPSSGATRAESVFPTKREGPARRRSRHAVVAEALVPPDAARVAIRIATRVATVYTNTLKWYREAIFGDLCTLLRSQGHPQPKPTSQQCTQMPQNGAERPFWPICVHSCVVALAVRPTSPVR